MSKKNLSRRDFLRLGGLAAAGAAAAACSPTPEVVEKVVTKEVEVEKVVKETVVVTAEPPPAEKPTIKVFTLESFIGLMDGTASQGAGVDVLTALEEEMNIEWNLTAWDGFEQKVKQELTSPTPSNDVVWLLDRWGSPTIYKNLVNLSTYQEADPIDNFDEVVPITPFTYQGNVLGVPYRTAWHIMYYNKQMYAEQVGSEDPPATAEEYWENVAKCTYQNTDGADVYGLATDGAGKNLLKQAFMYDAAILSDDYEVVVNSENMLEWLNAFTQAFQAGSVPPNFETISAGEAQNFVAQGLATHIVVGADDGKELNNPDESLIAGQAVPVPMPAWSKTGLEIPPHQVATWGMVIPTAIPDANKDAAWQFIKHVSQPDFTLAMAMNGNGPTRISVFNAPEYAANEPAAHVIAAVAPNAKILVPPFEGASECMDIFAEEVIASARGDKTPEEALANAEIRCQSVVEQWTT